MSIDFHESTDEFRGTGISGREWRITPAFTGWRLEFTDPGDAAPTFAGVHGSVAAAKAEANTPLFVRRGRSYAAFDQEDG
jgi:hypothetical protein